MGFNYSLERAKFDATWERLRKQYSELGMSEKAINEMYEFDLKEFRKSRTNARHEKSYDGLITAWGDTCSGDTNPLVDEYFSTFTYEDCYSLQNRRFAWMDLITNIGLYEKVLALSEKDKEFLTLLIIDGYSKVEIAKLWGINPAAISVRFKKIKKKLSMFKF